MDPRFGTGEDRSCLFQPSPSSSSSTAVRDGYFAAQALLAGYTGTLDGMRRVELLPEPGSARGILEREFLKQRIREKIIAREMPEMRLLEEEVRRELEMERALAMGWLRESAFPLVGDVPALVPVASQFGLGVGVERRMVGVRPGGERAFGENVVGERLVGERLLQDVARGRLTNELALQQNDHENKGSVSSSAYNANPSKDNISGIKIKADAFPAIAQRKACELLLGSGKRDWSCALCQVSTASREGLEEHLQGKKHRAKLASVGISDDTLVSTPTMRANKLLALAKGGGQKAQTNPGEKNITKETGPPPPVKKQKTGTSFLCELCKLECSSNKTLVSHLAGKKHRKRLEATTQRKAGAATDVAEKGTAGVVQNGIVEEESKAASNGAEDRTGTVEEPTLEEKDLARLM